MKLFGILLITIALAGCSSPVLCDFDGDGEVTTVDTDAQRAAFGTKAKNA